MTQDIPYRAAGTYNGPSYIERDADRTLRTAIVAGQRYPYIVAPRQSGKSSLLLRTRRALDPREYRTAFVDLSLLEKRDHTSLWGEVLAGIAESTGLDPSSINPKRPMHSFQVWLGEVAQRIVVFLDETDSMLAASCCESFFSYIRGLYNRRSEDPSFARLTFVLAGAALPTQLITTPSTSPFNVGVEVPIDDLSLPETRQLVSHLGSSADTAIATHLHGLTGGSVYLSQLLLEKLWGQGQTGGIAVTVSDIDRFAGEIVASAASEVHFLNMYRAFGADGQLRTALADLLVDRSIDEHAAQMLRLVGVSDGVTPYRNLLYRRVFDRGGPLDLVQLIGGVSKGDEPPRANRPPAEVIALVDRLFCGDAAQFGVYERSDDQAAEVVIPTVLFRFVLSDPEQQRVSLQLYRGLRSIGGALWAREIRSLQRASSYQHPALPTILGGAYVDGEDLAFVITRAARHRLSEPGAMEFIASDRVEALRQFMVLAQGLGILHEQGITHRNLHPGSLEYIEESIEDRKRYSLRLSRFEMSAMVSNLVRRRGPGDTLQRDELRRIYRELDGAQDALAYCPPERAAWLFGDAIVPPESERSDVYALGVLAWRWLVERPEDLPWPAISGSDDLRRLHASMREKLRTRGDVPLPLAKLLASMLAPDPHARPSIFDVLDTLSRGYARLAASLEPTADEPTFFIGFMPEGHRQTTFRWGWIDEDPCEASGREALRAFLEQELRSAELLYCPDGVTGYLRTGSKRDREMMRSARYVLAGKQAYWFCDIYFEPGPAFNQYVRRVEQLLLIRYVVHHRNARRLDETHLRRLVPGEIKFVPVWSDQSIDLQAIRRAGRTWLPLLESVRHEQSTPAWMTTMESALDFLRALRRAEADARVFPYEVVGGDARTTVELGLDLPRDRGYQFADPLRSMYFRTMRTPMGRLFEELDGERTTLVAVFDDRDGRPNFTDGAVATLVFERRLDDNTLRLQAPAGGRGLPARGWLRPEGDAGIHMQLRRQEHAVQELLASRSLMHQLHNPSTIKGLRARWEHAGAELGNHRSRQIVQDMLRCEPFYALHGPPGSGKTTVTATAVVEHLKVEPGQRVLISSQSHNALDNLARRILARCGEDVVAVRILSDHAVAEEKPHPEMLRRRPEMLATAAVERITQACKRRLAPDHREDGLVVDDALRQLLEEWMKVAPGVELELCDRIRRGASLVFATTGACTPREVGAAGASGMYDWVIVEEAARAWPAELALPLVRGLRWTLIGDHFQLPAFDDLVVHKFLELCAASDDEELRAHGERSSDYHAVFRLFASLFDHRAQRRRERPANVQLTEPLDELDEQFRMHPDICRIVSRSFYRERVDRQTGALKVYEDGWLTTAASAKRPHNRELPRFLRGRAAVWLDTAEVPHCADQRAWKNPGEAEVIRRLLEEMVPVPGGRDEDFALLTPYNAQVELLRRTDLPAWALPRIYTTDGFQGREAEIVVVSLVRSVQRSPDRPEANIGHLVSPNRVNVLLSRARTLLIVVGRFEHFVQQAQSNRERGDVSFWKTVTDTFLEQDGVVSAADLLGRGGMW
jgi:hypothetical protein